MITIISTEEGIHFTCILPKDYIIPDRIIKSTPSELAVTFRMSSDILHTIDKMCIAEINTSTMKQIEADCSKKYMEELDELKRKNQTLLSKNENKLREAELLLIDKTVELKSIKERETEEIKKRTDEALTHTHDSHNKIISLMERNEMKKEADFKNTLTQIKEELKEAHEKLENRRAITQSSSGKGADGEMEFQTIVEERKGWLLTNVSKEAHSTDLKFCCTKFKANTRFEIKKYKSSVPTKEIDKFRRDMSEHIESDIGIFVSLDSGICNIPSSIHIEWSNDNQFLLYLPNFFKLDINTVLEFIENLFKIVPIMRKLFSKNDIKNESVAQDRINSTLTYIQRAILHIGEHMKKFNDNISQLKKAVDGLVCDERSFITSFKSEFELMIDMLKVGEGEKEEKELNNNIVETTIPLPSKKGRSKKLTIT